MFKRKYLRVALPVLAILLILGSLTVSGVFAALVDTTTALKTEFTQADLSCTVNQTRYTVRNKGNIPGLVRAKVLIHWVDADGAILPDAPAGASYEIEMGTDWSYVAKEGEPGSGYWYYNGIVAPGADTDALIRKLDKLGEGTLEVRVLAEVLQASPAELVAKIWPNAKFTNGAWTAR